jgi:RHS repeat-associated protein
MCIDDNAHSRDDIFLRISEISAKLCRFAMFFALYLSLIPVPTRAEDLGFAELPVGTKLNNQFPTITFLKYQNKVGGIVVDTPRGRVASFTDCSGCEFFSSGATIAFKMPHRTVMLHTGLLPVKGLAVRRLLRLTAFDVDGKPLKTDFADVTAGEGFGTALTVSTTTPQIATVTLEAIDDPSANASIALRDVVYFENALPDEGPDFVLGAPAGVSLSHDSAQRKVMLSVRRIRGSVGKIRFSVDLIPPGIETNLSPNPTNSNKVLLDIKTRIRPTPAIQTLLVTGTPMDPSAGLAPHTISIRLYAQPPSGKGGANSLAIPLDTIVPPDADASGVVPGTLPGNSDVSPDGAARYSLPIWVPPGRNGMQPDLTISYNSRIGNGPLGVGWTLAGIPEIQRCERSNAIDGYASPITFDAQDPFCLDGQRLVLISGKNGQPQAVYKTERDTFSKIVVEEGQNGVPTKFSVYEKSGRIMRFGGSEQFLRSANRPDTSVPVGWLLAQIEDRYGNVILFSYLDIQHELYPLEIIYTGSLTNRNLIPNRSIYFEYESRTDVEFSAALGFRESTQRLSRIYMYGPDEAMQQAILRVYELTYSTILSITHRSLLTSIAESDANCHVLHPTNDCRLSPTIFEWTHGEDGFDIVHTGINDFFRATDPSQSEFKGFQFFDINGDGMDDLLYMRNPGPNCCIGVKSDDPEYFVRLSTGSGFGPPIELGTHASLSTSAKLETSFTFPLPMLYSSSEPPGLLFWAKWNISNPQDPSWPAVAQVVTDVSTPKIPRWATLNFAIQPATSPVSPAFETVIPMDVDGDGLADLVTGATAGGVDQWQFYVNQSNHMFASPKTITFPPEFEELQTIGFRVPMRGVDVEGDGRQELILCRPIPPPDPSSNNESPGVVISFRHGVGESYSTDLITCNDGHSDKIDHAPIFLDANGDGLDDVAFPTDPEIMKSTAPSALPKIGMTTVLNLGPKIPSVPNRIMDHELINGVRVFDYDGDGHLDLVGTRALDFEPLIQVFCERPEIRVYRSTTTSSGIQLTQVFPTTTSECLPISTAPNPDLELIQVGDVNGDGLQDLVTIQNGEFVLYVRKGKRPDMLVRVVNGVGMEAKFRYEPISNPTVYKTSKLPVYPQRVVVGGLQVVAEHDVSNDSGSPENQYLHYYENGIEDIRGRGFLGFEVHEVEEQRRSTKIRREYDLRPLTDGSSLYPFAGLPSKETTTTLQTAPGLVCEGLLRERVVSWQYDSHLDPETKIYAPSAADILIEESECANGKKVPTYRQMTHQSVDEYGNIRLSGTALGNGDFYGSILTYDNSYSDWLIDRKVNAIEISFGHGKEVVRRTAYRYDASGSLELIAIEPGDDTGSDIKPLPQPQPDGVSTLFVRYDRNPNGQIARIAYDVDFTPTQAERFTKFFYEDADQIFLTRTVDKLNHTTQSAFHPGIGVQAAALNANGVGSRWQYDTFGRLKRTEPGASEASSLTYSGYAKLGTNPMKLRLEVTEAGDSGWKSRTRFDALGRPTLNTTYTRLDGKGVIASAFGYDDWGHLIDRDVPRFEGNIAVDHNFFQFDNIGRLIRAQAADGYVTAYTYRGLQTDIYDADPDDPAVTKTTTTRDTGGMIVSSVQHLRANADEPARDLYVEFDTGPFATVEHVRSLGVQIDMLYDRLGRLLEVIDPSRGRHDYKFNAFGEVVTETITKGGSAPDMRQYQYDDLGRIRVVTTRDGATKYVWDESPQGIGQLSSLTSPQNIVTTFRYDDRGLISHKVWEIDHEQFDFGTEYDSFGRLRLATYPDSSGRGFAVRYQYGTHGSLQKIINDGTLEEYWTRLEVDETGSAVNPSGAFPRVQLGNGVITQAIENSSRPGQLGALRTKLAGTTIQDLNYVFDTKNNLKSRIDARSKTTEVFDYDELDRLRHWTISGQTRVRYDYDDLANLRARVQEDGSGQDITYDYAQTNGAGPYAVTAINGQFYFYDEEGNQIAGPNRTIKYSTLGLPLHIADRNQSYDFGYDGFGNRVFKGSNEIKQVLSIANLYERRSGGLRPQLFTILGPYGSVCQVVRPSDGTPSDSLRYIHPDNLGSTESVTDETGKIVETRQYDPFGSLIGFSLLEAININGKQNNGNSGCGGGGNCFGLYQNKLAELGVISTSAGFTGHRDDADLSLIDMGGREYDPITGRFLSPDLLDNSSLTNGELNRYAYAINNPTTLVDPTGFESDEPGNNFLDWGSWDYVSPGALQPGQGPPNLGRASGPAPTYGGSNFSPPQAPYNAVDDIAVRTSVARIDYQPDRWYRRGFDTNQVSPNTLWVNAIFSHGLEPGFGCLAGGCDETGFHRETAFELGLNDLTKAISTVSTAYALASVPIFLARFAAAEAFGAAAAPGAFGIGSSIYTPYERAIQAGSKTALEARTRVEQGAVFYRIGTTNISAAAEGQFWSLEHPLTPGYAARHGIPPTNLTNWNFIEAATLRPGSQFLTRVAPGIGSNPGGGIEIVVPEKEVILKWFGFGPW